MHSNEICIIFNVRDFLMDNIIEQSDNEILVINYLDMHADIQNNKIQTFSINELKKEFPQIDEFTIKLIHDNWRKGRQRMIEMKFD